MLHRRLVLRFAQWLPMGCSLLAAACSASSTPATSAPPPPPPNAAAPSTATSAASAAPPPATGASTAPTKAKLEDAELVRLLDFVQELEVDVHSIGIGQPRVAVLSDDPWLKDKDGWKKIPLPKQLRPAPDQAEFARIFFGRDDRPRIMGWRSFTSSEGKTALYLRYKPDGWYADRNEIGRLSGNPPAALFGVLGHEDPEVVCKVGDVCIIKRRTGWKTIEAGEGLPLVELCGADAWAIHDHHLAKLTQSGWVKAAGGPPWQSPSGFWAVSDDNIWVATEADSQLYHYDGKAWTSEPSPVREPRSFWATSQSSVWLVGSGGAAHFDGGHWRLVEGLTHPLRVIRGASEADVWAGGEAGLWHGTKS